MDATFFGYFLHSNGLIAFGVMLLAGLLGGHLAHKTRCFPRIIGYIFIGFVLGPHVINLLTQTILDQSEVYAELAIGLILFELGLRINLIELLSKPVLLWIAAFQSITVFSVILIGLTLLNINFIVSALAASIGVSISPAVTLLIANEYNGKGTVIQHSLILTALNNINALLLYAVVVSVAQQISIQSEHYHSLVIELLYPFYRMLGSIILAYLLANAMIWIGKLVGKKENMQFILLVSILMIALGLSKLLYVSPFLTMLVLGILTETLDRKKDLLEVELGYMSEIFIVILFVSVGADLQIDYFIKGGWLAVTFILLRTVGSTLTTLLLKSKTYLNYQQIFALNITLLPMAGIAIALLSTTEKLTKGINQDLSIIVLPAVAILEIIGPVTTILGLRWVGELNGNKKLDH